MEKKKIVIALEKSNEVVHNYSKSRIEPTVVLDYRVAMALVNSLRPCDIKTVKRCIIKDIEDADTMQVLEEQLLHHASFIELTHELSHSLYPDQSEKVTTE